MIIRKLWIAASVSLLSVVAGCGGHGEAEGERDGRPAVAVSFAPQEWLLRQLAGDKVEIVTLLPPGADPERFEPSVGVMKSLGRATLWMEMGTDGFEEQLVKSISSNFPDLQVSDVSSGIARLEEGHEGEGDPHLLGSLRNARLMASNMTDRLVRLLPEDEEELREANAILQSRLRRSEERIASMLTDSTLSFMTLHPSLSYFARDYNIRQIALEQGGKEPTPVQMAGRLREGKGVGSRVMVIDKEHPVNGVREMAEGEGMKVVEVSLNDTTFVAELERVAAALKE